MRSPGQCPVWLRLWPGLAEFADDLQLLRRYFIFRIIRIRLQLNIKKWRLRGIILPADKGMLKRIPIQSEDKIFKIAVVKRVIPVKVGLTQHT